MRTGLASTRQGDGLDSLVESLKRFEEEWQRGEPDLARHWERAKDSGDFTRLSALVKADMNCRFARGERPTADEYLHRFPELGEIGERVLSLVYEEFCLLEERGEQPDSKVFCARYAPWTDSLASQLAYHRMLSRVVGTSPVVPRLPNSGERFMSFALISELGRGGAARVFLARDESLGGREVALKVSADRGSEPSILGRLEHPHIVPVLSVVRPPDSKLCGLCMPYRAGCSLEKVIARINPASRPKSARVLRDALSEPESSLLPVSRERGGATASLQPGPGWNGFPEQGSYVDGVVWVIAVLAEALAYAHERSTYHRDVKPANILLSHRDGPQLLDFNLAHDPYAASEAEAALRGGTIPYMAPEQIEAFREPALWDKVGAPADLYSLGLVLRELLTGQAPKIPDLSVHLPRAIRATLDQRLDFRPDLRKANRDVPHALEAIAEKCLAYAPEERYPNAQALADDLRRFLERRPLRSVRNPSRRERMSNWLFRNRASLAVGAVVSALVMASFVVTDLTGAPGPVESRSEFLRVSRLVDSGDVVDARNSLLKWAAENPDSAVLRFYLAASQAKEQPELAVATLETLFSHSRSEDALVAWARDRPAVARLAEELGAAAFQHAASSGASGLTPKAQDSIRALAAKALRLAERIRHEPSSWSGKGIGLIAAFYQAGGSLPPFKAAQADAATAWVWSQEGAEEILIAWGRAHPPFARLVAGVGLGLINKTYLVTHPRRAEVIERAKRSLELALKIDPTLEVAHHDLALVDEVQGDFASAYKRLTRLIPNGTDGQAAGADDKHAFILWTRARISVLWAESLLADRKAGPAKEHLVDAFRDLERGEHLVQQRPEPDTHTEPGFRKGRFDFLYVQCQATLNLGAALAIEGQPKDAAAQFQKAEEILEDLSRRSVANRRLAAAYEQIREQVRKAADSMLAKPPRTSRNHPFHPPDHPT